MRRPASLLSQTLAVNSALLLATVLAAAVAANLDPAEGGHALPVLVAGMLATVLGNGFVLRRRFAPLGHLIAAAERVDLASPGTRATAAEDEPEDVARLRVSFNRMLERLEAERAAGASAVLRAQEAERARLARDLHDEVNQSLTAVTLRLQASALQAPPQLAEELEETRLLATQAMQELRGLARELRPAALDDHGLLPALRTQVEEFGRHTGLTTCFEADDDLPDLREEDQLVVYRVVQESLSNVVRHAGADRVEVTISTAPDGGLRASVRDDGRGFPPRPVQGLGLPGMRERALLAGGRLEVRSRPGWGTTVELTL